ncbi:hypothetical protein [Bradyrhizobium sp. STM 3562]|uniref:hypothetical protein n=1 Tax=Bradyrhizobium sp. STM 3562 TaxID=578924 RepID=UPI00388EFC69
MKSIQRTFSARHFWQLQAQLLVLTSPVAVCGVAPLDTNSVNEIAKMCAVLEVAVLPTLLPSLPPASWCVLNSRGWKEMVRRRFSDFEMTNGAFYHALVAHCAIPRPLASLDASRAQFTTRIRDCAKLPLANRDPIRITA